MAERARSLVAIGASAGGIEAVSRVLADLPADLGAPVLVVVHTAPTSDSMLAQVLRRNSALPVEPARDGQAFEPNRVYVAPPDRHLIVADGHAHVVRGPHENRHRPAIDPLLRSAAVAFRERAVAVILTGSLDDGAAGSVAITRMGGRVFVQDPAEAAFPSMPRSAIAADSPAAVLPVSELAAAVAAAVRREPSTDDDAEDAQLRSETEYAALGREAIDRDGVFGSPSPFSCPSCGGVLWEAPGAEPPRYRCRIGHAFGAETLLVDQSDALDASLATALRALKEHAHFARRVGNRLRAAGLTERAAHYAGIEARAQRDAEVIRNVLLDRGADGT